MVRKTFTQTEYGTRIVKEDAKKEPKIMVEKPGKKILLNPQHKEAILNVFNNPDKIALAKMGINEFVQFGYTWKKNRNLYKYENVIRAKLIEPIIGIDKYYKYLEDIPLKDEDIDWVDDIPYVPIYVFNGVLKDYLENATEQEVLSFGYSVEDWSSVPRYIQDILFEELEKRILRKHELSDDIKNNLLEYGYLGDLLNLLEAEQIIKELPELAPEERANLDPEVVKEEEKIPDIKEIEEMPKKSAVKTIAKSVAAGAAPGVITMNPEGAAVGAAIGAVAGVATAVKDAVIEKFTEADKLKEIPKQTVGTVDPIIPMVTEAEACKLDNTQVAVITTGPEDDPELNKVAENGQANLTLIDTNKQEADAIEEELVHLDGGGGAPEIGADAGVPEVDVQLEVVNTEVNQGKGTDMSSRGIRPGYYKNPIHEDALGLFFGSATNPNWNNALFYDRMGRLTNEDIIANKTYFYNQSVMLVNKYGVDFLVPSVKYMQNADPLMIIKENHEILQLYFKLKGIKPTEREDTYKMIEELHHKKKQFESQQDGVDIDDYESGHNHEGHVSNKNPFRAVDPELELNPADAYEMRLLGNGVPVEARKTFKGEPTKLNKTVERSLKASSAKGQLPTTVNKNVVERAPSTMLRFASEEEQCKNIFGIFTE